MSQDTIPVTLQAWRQQARQRWEALAPRERRLGTVALGLLAFTLLVMLLVRPAWRTLSDTPAKLNEVQSQLERMRRWADEAQALRSRPSISSSQAEAALQAATVRLGPGVQLQVQADRATLAVTRVSGAALATWLQEVRISARAKPSEARLNQIEPGTYAGTLVLSLASAATTP